jgi:hypothetical protein
MALNGSNLTALSKLLSLPSPQLDFKWVCLYLPFNHPLHYVESIDVPWLNISVGDKTHAGSTYEYYPGTHDIQPVSITFYEDERATSLKYVTNWKSKVKSLETGFYNLPTVYKQEVRAQLLDTSNNPVVSITLTGVWPSETQSYSLKYTDAGRLVVTQSFSVDNQRLQFHK